MVPAACALVFAKVACCLASCGHWGLGCSRSPVMETTPCGPELKMAGAPLIFSSFRTDLSPRINWEKQYKGDCNELGWIGIPRLVQSWSSGVHMWSLKMARLTETGWSYPRASTLSTVMRNCAAPWPPFLRCFCATRRQHRVPYGQTKWV